MSGGTKTARRSHPSDATKLDSSQGETYDPTANVSHHSIAITGVLVAAALATKASAQTNMSASVKNIVFVHGARADGSYWSKAIPLPQAKELQRFRSPKSTDLAGR